MILQKRSKIVNFINLWLIYYILNSLFFGYNLIYNYNSTLLIKENIFIYNIIKAIKIIYISFFSHTINKIYSKYYQKYKKDYIINL